MPNEIPRGHREIAHDADREIHGDRQYVYLYILRLVFWGVLPLVPVQWSGEIPG